VLERIRESERNRGPRTSKANGRGKPSASKGRPGKRERAIKKATTGRK
jgi:hypothetical protein